MFLGLVDTVFALSSSTPSHKRLAGMGRHVTVCKEQDSLRMASGALLALHKFVPH